MAYTSAQAKAFIAHIAPLMAAEAKKRGYKIVSTAIAQAIKEGAAGTSVLAKTYHNHFGMKCGSSWKGKSVNLKTKEEYTPGKLTTIRDNFRVYDSDEEGVSGYYDFISLTRYKNLKSAATYSQYAQYLKSDGWATDSGYSSSLCNIVAKYGLTEWDKGLGGTEAAESVASTALDARTIRNVKAWYNKTYSALQIKYIQRLLNGKGYSLAEDGLIGSLTIGAVLDFQKKNGLNVDGKAGKLTVAALEK